MRFVKRLSSVAFLWSALSCADAGPAKRADSGNSDPLLVATRIFLTWADYSDATRGIALNDPTPTVFRAFGADNAAVEIRPTYITTKPEFFTVDVNGVITAHKLGSGGYVIAEVQAGDLLLRDSLEVALPVPLGASSKAGR
jgi:hypothetical protein